MRSARWATALGAPREPRAARGGVRGGRTLLRRRLGAASSRRLRRRRRTRPSCAISATRSTAGRCGRPGTPPRTRWRRSSSGSCRAGRPPASACAATTVSSGPCSTSGGRRPRPTARRRASRFAATRRIRIRRAGSSGPRSCRAPPPAPGRRAERPRGSRGRRTAPATGRGALLELLASREGSKRLDLGDGRVAVREYESVWLERGPVPFEGRVRWGRGRSRRPARACTCAAGAPAIGSRATARRCRTSSSTPRSRARSAKRGRSSSGATRSSPSPGSRGARLRGRGQRGAESAP